MKITYNRVHDGCYDVLLDGVIIGRVSKSWHRLGGAGWAVSGYLNRQAGKTRKEATRSMMRGLGFAHDEYTF